MLSVIGTPRVRLKIGVFVKKRLQQAVGILSPVPAQSLSLPRDSTGAKRYEACIPCNSGVPKVSTSHFPE